MKIMNLTDLKSNKIFKLLHKKQSEYDATDDKICNDTFTRSPLHLIQFLIVYAGLDDAQRQLVVNKLQISFTQQELDELVNDIDWTKILTLPIEGNLTFQFTAGLGDKNIFLKAMEQKCPNLFHALTSENCNVTVENKDTLQFTTLVTQKESWTKAFSSNFLHSRHWKVQAFKLSPSLEAFINELQDNAEASVGGFTIKKGVSSNLTELRIPMPPSEIHSITSQIQTNPGIYAAFEGLTDFYGLAQVSLVTVKVENNANFDEKGTFAAQKQTFSVPFSAGRYISLSKPTIITVNNLNVFFQGIDIVINFSGDNSKAIDFDPNFYIILPTTPTKSTENTQIALLAQAPNPKDAFLLITEGKLAQLPALTESPKDLVPNRSAFFPGIAPVTHASENIEKATESPTDLSCK